eukprot:scaffold22348_cov101-Isochrysis_galbana.AAC.2
MGRRCTDTSPAAARAVRQDPLLRSAEPCAGARRHAAAAAWPPAAGTRRAAAAAPAAGAAADGGGGPCPLAVRGTAAGIAPAAESGRTPQQPAAWSRAGERRAFRGRTRRPHRCRHEADGGRQPAARGRPRWCTARRPRRAAKHAGPARPSSLAPRSGSASQTDA